MKKYILPVILLTSINSYAEINLIGGHDAASNEYTSTVSIPGNCTASKIASMTFLLAAHCVTDLNNAAIKKKFQSGSVFTVRTHYGVSYNVTVERTYAHDSYITGLQKRIALNISRSATGIETYDIAVFTVKEKTPKIPVAQVGLERVMMGEKVVIGGWGCEEKVGGVYDYTNKSHYKIAETEVVDHKTITQDYHKLDNSQINKFNFLTKGMLLDDETASLCPGDSGGPAYRESDGAVVGVNSYYVFKDNSGIAFINTHTRVSEVSDWVKKFLD